MTPGMVVCSDGVKGLKMAKTHMLSSLSFMGMSFWKSCLVRPERVSTAHVKMRGLGVIGVGGVVSSGPVVWKSSGRCEAKALEKDLMSI